MGLSEVGRWNRGLEAASGGYRSPETDHALLSCGYVESGLHVGEGHIRPVFCLQFTWKKECAKTGYCLEVRIRWSSMRVSTLELESRPFPTVLVISVRNARQSLQLTGFFFALASSLLSLLSRFPLFHLLYLFN